MTANSVTTAAVTRLACGDLFVTAITIAEMECGVIAEQRCDAGQAAILRRWFDDNALPTFDGRVILLDCRRPTP